MQQVSRQNYDRKASRAQRRAATWFSISIILGLLGIGNVSYGHWKAEQYSAILRKSPISVTAQDQNSKRLVATIEFYKVVIFGGRSLLGVGALALLIAFIARSHARKLRAKPQSTLNKLALDP